MGREVGDVRAVKAARAELAKRGVDVTLCDLRALHGILYIRGTVKAYRGSPIHDIRAEMELIGRLLKQKSDIKDVILECSYRS